MRTILDTKLWYTIFTRDYKEKNYENNVRELLPIGSVVKIKGVTKKMMIYGVKQTDQETGKEYDYIGVVYP